MKLNRFFVTSLLLATDILLFAMTVPMFFCNRVIFWIELAVCVVAGIATALRLLSLKRNTARYLESVAALLNETDRETLERFPFPVMLLSEFGTVDWYNEKMHDDVLEGRDVHNEPVESLFREVTLKGLARRRHADARVGEKQYDVFASSHQESGGWTLYFIDNTTLKNTAEEYEASRPALLMINIDGIDEVVKDLRESERAQIAGRVEMVLEDWIGETSGVFRKYESDRFVAIIEHRHLLDIIEKKFEILDRVRTIQVGEITGITISIGVGEGVTLRECEAQARKALEMAQGRGGDQAAIKTQNGYDFFGGRSRGIEKRSKIRSRMIADIIKEMISGTEIVFVMGHKYADLDCLGAATALTVAIRNMGKVAYTVVNRDTAMAPELIARYEAEGYSDLFLAPSDALEIVARHTLVIVTDTHNPQLVESLELYEAATQTVVIDHHRRMAPQLENAVIFHHESTASSASEMVTELIQYLPESHLGALEAEALLAGMMLDTRNFVMNAGTYTFEAAAYLRSLGADTVSVKRLFSGSMDQYRVKGEIVSSAEEYRGVAIACTEITDKCVRIAASQAADELLSIRGVTASFVLYAGGTTVNLSARSYGDVNVQLIAESLGGGGHQAMAGAQIKNTDLKSATALLKESIDRYLDEKS